MSGEGARHIRPRAEMQVAWMLLTRMPAGRIAAPIPPLAACRWAYPLVGALLGLMGWAAFAVAEALGLPPVAAAVLSLAALALATGALHEDGLADYADGTGAGAKASPEEAPDRIRARRLEIMADSRLGTFGALALMLTLGLRATALATLAPGPLAFMAVAAGSRAAMLALQDTLPPARKTGLGATAAAAFGGRTALGLTLGAAALAALGLPGLAVLGAMALSTLSLGAHARARLGGQTGDVLGAAQQLAETAGWLALLALAAP